MASASSVTASAPGTVMLIGEHAVLHGRRALVCAVDYRITVTLTPRADRELRMASELGRHQTTLDNIQDTNAFRFVTGVFRERGNDLGHGFDVRIDSDFSSTIGLGSSAAVTVASAMAIDGYLGTRPGEDELHARCLRVIRDIQGRGSGADLAASIQGGVIIYRATPYSSESLGARPPLVLVYSGHKTPTPEVIRIVENNRAGDPARFDMIFDEMDHSIDTAAKAIRQENWKLFGRLLAENQLRMEALGVHDEALDEIISGLRNAPGIYGAKISGSGLGDCVVAAGQGVSPDMPYPVIPVSVCQEGVRLE